MQITLNQCEWKVKGYWPYVPLLRSSVEIGTKLDGVTNWVNAHVPGCVQMDLIKAGLIMNPHFDNNSLNCEWVEHRWWMYCTKIQLEEGLKNKKLFLVFKGVDYVAHVYLNGKKLGKHEGMFEAFSFDISSCIEFDKTNELQVLIEAAPEEMSQIGFTSGTRTQKSRFSYKWDFGTRLVPLGIWDDVFIEAIGEVKLSDSFVRGSIRNGQAFIDVDTKLVSFLESSMEESLNCELVVKLKYKGECLGKVCKKLNFVGSLIFTTSIPVSNPHLWFPNGNGPQPLYELELEVLVKGVLSHHEKYNVGIRILEYLKNDQSPEDALPYKLLVNGVPVYIKGVNITPLDLMYGNISDETYSKYIQMIKHANINLIRVWGGGIIEKKVFYEMCDANGIMVWQEFIQSSSGIENVPSTHPHFLGLLKNTAIQAVKEKRNHVCHTFWSGGNELTDEDGIPVTDEHPNICMLKKVVEEYDPEKLFLPTSASGPNEFLNIDQPGKNYDVHGGWKYEGVLQHYIKYNKSDSLFHSEFGVDGCSHFVSLKKFLSEQNLKITNMKENLIWRHHGEWWDTFERDSDIFGEFENLEQFVKASQFIQAEGLRYILEANRRRKYQNTGSIVWQFNEPWPNVSCTSLVDYYKNPKMAYYWLKKAYSRLHVSLSYSKLSYAVNEQFNASLFVHIGLGQSSCYVEWSALDVRGNCVANETIKVNCEEYSCSKAADISILLPEFEVGIFFIRLKIYDSLRKEVGNNLYLFSQREEQIFASLLKIYHNNLHVEKTNEGYLIQNKGEYVCLFIHGVDPTEKRPVIIDRNYDSLFPGEKALFNECLLDSTEHTEIEWCCF